MKQSFLNLNNVLIITQISPLIIIKAHTHPKQHTPTSVHSIMESSLQFLSTLVIMTETKYCFGFVCECARAHIHIRLDSLGEFA